MDLNWTQTILAEAGATQQDPKVQTLQFVGMMVIMVVLFYFVLIRPQQKKQKEQAALLSSVKPGDRVLTSGGVLGVVLTVKEKSITLRSADAKMEISKSAIAEITERAGASSEA